MDIVEVDERAISLEFVEVKYYVQIYAPSRAPGGNRAVVTYLATGAEVDEVMEWASVNSPKGHIYSIGVASGSDASEVSWVIGTDPNSALPGMTERLNRMVARAWQRECDLWQS